MKGLLLFIALVMLVAILAEPSASAVSYTNIPHNETTTSQTEASNSSASATITITMYTLPDE